MAKVILGPMVGQASGKIGGMVFSRNRGGTYVRRRAHPTTNTSEWAEAAKAAFAAVSGAWEDLSAAARQAFSVWAANNPIVDRLGNKITLDGHAAYVRLNAFRFQLGESLLTLPPTVSPPAGLSTMTLEGAVVSNLLNVKFTPSQAATSMVLAVKACIREGPAREYVKGDLRFCSISPVAQISQINVLSMIQTRLGTVQNGDVVHVEVCTYDPASGLRSLPLSASAAISGIA